MSDDGEAIFQRLEEDKGAPIEILTPEVGGGLGSRLGMTCPVASQPLIVYNNPSLIQVKEALLKNIKRRMTPQPLKIRADVELTCFHYDGIEHIKDAMRAAEV